MHFNFHLSGDESPEQTRRIANAVLALGGLLTPAKSTSAGEITVDVKIDTTNATAALDKLAAHPGAKWVEEDAVTTNVGESPSGGLRYFTVSPETGIEIPCEPMSANEFLDLVSSPAVPVAPLAHAADPSGLDSKGLPWDERIHSSSRKFNADGSWRYRKNVPDETKASVEGELRGLMAIMAPTIASTQAVSEACDALEAMMSAQPGVPAEVLADDVPTMEVMLESGPVEIPLAPVTPPAPPLPPVITSVEEIARGEVHAASAPHVPPAPTLPAARTYPDVVNLIMKNKITPETYVAIIGSDLPTFAATCKTDPNAANAAYDALDRASRS